MSPHCWYLPWMSLSGGAAGRTRANLFLLPILCRAAFYCRIIAHWRSGQEEFVRSSSVILAVLAQFYFGVLAVVYNK